MAEAFLTKNPIPQKKRKADGKNNTNARTQKTLTLSEDANLAAAVASVVRSANVSDPRQPFLAPEKTTGAGENVPGGSEFKRTYHLGAKKYAVFHGGQGLIEKIHLKEWDGKTVNSSVGLSVSKFVMILHNSEFVSQQLARICMGDKNIEVKVHIGELFYITCSSPYKVVQFRKWRKNKDDQLFPTKEGISLKLKEWEEFLKYDPSYKM